MPPLVQVEQLEKSYGAVRALDHVSFDVEAGELPRRGVDPVGGGFLGKCPGDRQGKSDDDSSDSLHEASHFDFAISTA